MPSAGVILRIGLVTTALSIFPSLWGAEPSTLSISKLDRTSAVDFEKEILPLFKAKCLACHNQTRAKAELVLETPQTILKGSENGPVVIPGRGEDSLLLQVASHRAKPTMPPRDNKVGAADFAPADLGLLKLWIDQGAKGEVRSDVPISWQSLPESFRPIYAVALTSDGQFAACSRANRIFLYHLSDGRAENSLFDAQVSAGSVRSGEPVAHRDTVRALAFNRDGTLLASGGYREIKLWRREPNVPSFQTPPETNEFTAIAIAPKGDLMATGDNAGRLRLSKLPDGAFVASVDAHQGPVHLLRFSADGARVLSYGASDRVLRLWEVSGMKGLGETNLASEATALGWLEKTNRFLVGDRDGGIRIWSAPDGPGESLQALKGIQVRQAPITSLVAMPGSDHQVIYGAADGVVCVLDIQSDDVLREMKQGSPTTCIAVRADGRRMATVGTDRRVRLWALDGDKPLAEMGGDRYASERLAQTERVLHAATNELLYSKAAFDSADKERKSQVDRVRKAGTALTTAEASVAEKQTKLDEASKQKATVEEKLNKLKAAVAQAKDSLKSKDQSAQDSLSELRVCFSSILGRSSSSNAARLSQDPIQPAPSYDEAVIEHSLETAISRARAAGEAKAQMERAEAEFDAQKSQAEAQLNAAKKLVQEGETELKKAEQTKSNGENELNLAIMAAQKNADAANDAQNAIALAEAETKRAELQLDAARRASLDAELPIRAVFFSRDNRFLVTAGEDRCVHTWNADTGQAVETYRGAGAPVIALGSASTGEIVGVTSEAAALGWKSGPTWTLERTLGTGHAAPLIIDCVNALTFSPDGKTLASGSGQPSRSGQIQLWDVANGNMIQESATAHSDAVLCLAFSPSGRYLASGSADRFMKVTDLETGKVIRSFEGHTHHVLGLAWDQSGRMLATAGADNVVKLWDFRTGERKKNIEGFAKEVTSIGRFGDDQFLATSGDHQVRLINEKGEDVRSYSGGAGFIYSAATTPDGTRVVAGGDESVLWIWEGKSGERLASLGPPLSPDAEHAVR
jgi:WD40 repeat protein